MNNQSSNLNWKELLEEFDSRKISAKAFAAEKGINPPSMYWQLRKRKQTSTKDSRRYYDSSVGSSAPRFIPVISEATDDAEISIRIGKTSIDIKRGFDPVLLKQVLAVIGESC